MLYLKRKIKIKIENLINRKSQENIVLIIKIIRKESMMKMIMKLFLMMIFQRKVLNINRIRKIKSKIKC